MATAPTTFVREAVDELKKVTWPTRAEITRLTVSVIIVATVVGVFLGGVDFILTKVLEFVLSK